MRARPSILLFESANPRHAHEVDIFRSLKEQIPANKVLVPGVIDSTTNFIEHPQLVAKRLLEFSSIVGKERYFVRLFERMNINKHFKILQGPGGIRLWICNVWKITNSLPWHSLGKTEVNGSRSRNCCKENCRKIDVIDFHSHLVMSWFEMMIASRFRIGSTFFRAIDILSDWWISVMCSSLHKLFKCFP